MIGLAKSSKSSNRRHYLPKIVLVFSSNRSNLFCFSIKVLSPISNMGSTLLSSSIASSVYKITSESSSAFFEAFQRPRLKPRLRWRAQFSRSIYSEHLFIYLDLNYAREISFFRSFFTAINYPTKMGLWQYLRESRIQKHAKNKYTQLPRC